MKKSKIKMGKICLYSKLLNPSNNFHIIKKCHNDDEIEFKIKFISEYIDNHGPSIYFTAIVSFIAVLSNSGIYNKKEIKINDIYFKNELNVLDSSRINEYEKLYFNNHSSSDRSIFSNSSHSFSSIINNGFEKQLTTEIEKFFSSDNFKIFKQDNSTHIVLDVNPKNINNIIFPTAKTIIKYLINSSDSSKSFKKSSSKKSSSKKSSSKKSNHKNNKFVKLLIISTIAFVIISLLIKLYNNNTKQVGDNQTFLKKIKNLIMENNFYKAYKSEQIEKVNN